MNFLRTTATVCSGFAGYRDVRDLPLTSSLKYLIQLMSVLAAGVLGSLIPLAMQSGNQFAGWVDDHVTPFAIEKGSITTSIEQPYRVGDTNFAFVLDTTGTVTAPVPQTMRGVLFTADSVVAWSRVAPDPDAPTYIARQRLRDMPNGRVDGDYFRRLIRTYLWVGLPVTFLVTVLLGSLTALLQAYLFCVVTSWMERSMPAPLKFHQLLNIAIHAVTPAAIVVTAFLAMRLKDLSFGAIYLVVYGIFLIGATNACRDQTQPEVQEDDDGWL